MDLATILRDNVLPCVEKPSRYLGHEVNAIHKDPRAVDVRLALCFPDLYDLGLGNLGLQILYTILNQLDGVWAERVYAPALDLERELRARGLPMFAQESKSPLSAYDGIGFTLQSELTFTNILNLLDLAGLPLRTAHRREGDPLTFAGGPAVFNPEPLAPFMDFFVIGDGEDVVVEIVGVLRRHRGRAARLRALAELEGVYVPALYPVETLADGRVLPVLGGPIIRKRTADVLDTTRYPVQAVVPFTEQAHDRASLEVLRGCTQGCRFCQAGMTTRPVRERSLPDLADLQRRMLDATGYDEVSLVSLSTCDYSRVRGLVDQSVRIARERNVAVSLPSLRLDSFSVDLADMVAQTRRTGLTFAPEAASPRLRALINKWIPDEDLIEMSSQAYARGWDHVKLYFMIGLPTERDDDIDAIADLCARTVDAGRRHNRRAAVRLGVSTFVPKPFTPFQWAEQIDREETEARQRRLLQRLGRSPAVKFGRHHPEETWVEGLVSRADRRAGDLIEAAWRQGARFDAWSEHLRVDAWERAIAETGFDARDALRARDPDERLPWDHLDIHIPKAWFRADWERALVLQHAPDCRNHKCHKCGVIDVKRPLCAAMLRGAVAGAKEERSFSRAPVEARPHLAPVRRVRFRVGRVGEVRLLSHLETMEAWVRAIRRAKLPICHSQGFHPLPRLNFSSALPVGEESTGEYMDVYLGEPVPVDEALARLRAQAPPGFVVLGATEVAVNAPGLMGLVKGAVYRVEPRDGAGLGERVAALLDAAEVPRERDSKKGRITVNIRPMIEALEVGADGALRLVLREVDGRPGKAKEVVELLGLDGARVIREDVLVEVDGARRSPGEGWTAGAELAGAAR